MLFFDTEKAFDKSILRIFKRGAKSDRSVGPDFRGMVKLMYDEAERAAAKRPAAPATQGV